MISLLGRLGQCRVMAGMRESQTIVDQDAVWFEGSDGNSNQFVAVRLGRDWRVPSFRIKGLSVTLGLRIPCYIQLREPEICQPTDVSQLPVS